MKVINIHTRILLQPKNKIEELFKTLSSKNDMMLETRKWPPMILDNGLNVGSKGGHGPIRYTVINFQPNNYVTFRFDLKGFDGFHMFEISELEINKTQIKHTIDMRTTGIATLKWGFAIRWLHDAFIEDAFDKIENHFTNKQKSSKWTIWVCFLRKLLKPKKK